MATPTDVFEMGCSKDLMCEIETSVCTGFEPMAQEEIQEMFGLDSIVSKGRVNVIMPMSAVKKVVSNVSHVLFNIINVRRIQLRRILRQSSSATIECASN